MAIYNLGQLQEYDVGSGISEALGRFSEGQQRRNLMEREIAGRKELATAQREAEAKTLLARTTMEREDQTRQMIQALWQKRSDMAKDQGELFDASDHGKEFYKFARGHVPELFDTEGKPILFPSTVDTIKQQLDAKIAEAKNTLISKGPDALTQGQEAALQMEGLTNEAAKVAFSVISNPSFPYLPPEKQTQMLQQAVEILKRSRGVRAPISTEGGMPGALAPSRTPISQEATPQRTRFKVRELR